MPGRGSGLGCGGRAFGSSQSRRCSVFRSPRPGAQGSGWVRPPHRRRCPRGKTKGRGVHPERPGPTLPRVSCFPHTANAVATLGPSFGSHAVPRKPQPLFFGGHGGSDRVLGRGPLETWASRLLDMELLGCDLGQLFCIDCPEGFYFTLFLTISLSRYIFYISKSWRFPWSAWDPGNFTYLLCPPTYSYVHLATKELYVAHARRRQALLKPSNLRHFCL